MKGTDIKFQILKTHKRNCSAFNLASNGEWAHPWCAIGETTRINVGRVKKLCFVARCNFADCNAKVAIEMDSVLTKIDLG